MGVAAGVLSLLGAAAVPAHAANWQVGDVSISLDSTFTLATSIRTEARDYDLIGNSNHPQFDWSGYHAAFNPLYPSGDVWGLADGGYSTNGDLGNLAHDPGDAFAKLKAAETLEKLKTKNNKNKTKKLELTKN